MREIPLLLNGPMVRAVLEWRKTVTRRIVKDAPTNPGSYVLGVHQGTWGIHEHVDAPSAFRAECPYGQPGGRLWVREAWRSLEYLDDLSGSAMADKCLDAGYRHPWAPIRYEADAAVRDWVHTGTPPHANGPTAGRYRHARFMPRWASRITLEVTGVRLERLQDISEDQAEAEGIGFLREVPDVDETLTARDLFRILWEHINGDGSWDSNPWVWAIEFKRIEQERKVA